MDTLQCAIVLAKWPRFEWEVAERVRIGARYGELLRERVPGFRPVTAAEVGSPLREMRALTLLPERTSVHAQYTILVPNRPAVQKALQAEGIPTAVHYPVPLNAQPAYAPVANDDPTPVSVWLAEHVMSLPMGPDLSAGDQDRVVESLAKSL